MSVTDSDLEQLDTLLDGEMPEQEAQVLRRRLIFEPALSAAMQTLEMERSLRVQVWQSMEPDQAAMDRVAARVDRKMNNHLRFARSLSNFRRLTAAAACIVVGVMVGRYGNWDRLTGGAAPTNNNTQLVTSEAHPPAPVPTAQPVKLAVVDDYGRVVDYVTFPSQEEANKFTNELQHENQKNSGPNGGAVLTSTPAEGKF
jgi:anti-sigma factor RsiW